MEIPSDINLTQLYTEALNEALGQEYKNSPLSTLLHYTLPEGFKINLNALKEKQEEEAYYKRRNDLLLATPDTIPNEINYAAIFNCTAHHKIPIFDWNECEIGAELGKGAAVTAHTGTAILWGKRLKVAFKVPNDTINTNTRARKVKNIIENSIQEIRLMAHLEGKHSNIINFYGLTFDGLQPILVMELAVSALDSYLDEKNQQLNPISLPTKTRFCWEIASGLEWLHSNTVIFGDLKAENVLVCLKANTKAMMESAHHTGIGNFSDPSNPNHKEEALMVKLADFGYSQTMLAIFDNEYPGVTPNFMPPEYFEESLKSWRGRQEGDIYSFGLTVHQIANNGMVPFENDDGPMVDDLNELKRNDLEVLNILSSSMLGKEEYDSLWPVISSSVRYKPAERELLRNLKQTLWNENMSDMAPPLKAVAAKWVDYREDSRQKTASEPNHEYELPSFAYLKSLPISDPLKKWLFQDYLKTAERKDINKQTIRAMLLMFECYQHGFGVEPNEEESDVWGSRFTNTVFNSLQPTVDFTAYVGAEQDLWHDIEWFKKSIHGDTSLAIVKMGMCYEHGWNLPKDAKMALSYYTQAASKGQDRAFINLGNLYANGIGMKEDFIKAIEWYLKAGIPQAQFKLGYIFSEWSGFKSSDPTECFSWYLKAANAGFPMAQYTLGNRYRCERVPGKDFVKAVEWHQKAADAGIVESYYILGVLYSKGDGVEQDFVKAVEWFQKSKDIGNTYAEFKLALAYYNGEGITKNPSLAYTMFRKLADSIPEAGYYLATALWNGNGCTQNLDEAMIWFRKASDAGDYKSKMHFARCYRYGLGVERDWLESADWYFTLLISHRYYGPPYQIEAPLIAAGIVLIVEYISLGIILWSLFGFQLFFISILGAIMGAIPKRTLSDLDEDIYIICNRRRTLRILLPRALYLYLIPVPEYILSPRFSSFYLYIVFLISLMHRIVLGDRLKFWESADTRTS